MDLIAYFAQHHGAQAALARALGVPQSLPSAWAAVDSRKRRPVPIERCCAIEVATCGAVTRRELRPDDWHLIWPELANAGGRPPPASAQEPAHA
ncbi:YdaS family helix-turn-helix protein [Acidovorax sp. Q11]